ncbi:unnamed protein product [Prorocentrum cordatum]|uniref:Uncharacterized protein n=2 Tax=Prorocentrum cordatum TaxID=2364126 RepID=A0ABN9RXZ0_9DINO|nr:unnamed protein product [Polarella glacialis]
MEKYLDMVRGPVIHLSPNYFNPWHCTHPSTHQGGRALVKMSLTGSKRSPPLEEPARARVEVSPGSPVPPVSFRRPRGEAEGEEEGEEEEAEEEEAARGAERRRADADGASRLLRGRRGRGPRVGAGARASPAAGYSSRVPAGKECTRPSDAEASPGGKRREGARRAAAGSREDPGRSRRMR